MSRCPAHRAGRLRCRHGAEIWGREDAGYGVQLAGQDSGDSDAGNEHAGGVWVRGVDQTRMVVGIHIRREGPELDVRVRSA